MYAVNAEYFTEAPGYALRAGEPKAPGSGGTDEPAHHPTNENCLQITAIAAVTACPPACALTRFWGPVFMPADNKGPPSHVRTLQHLSKSGISEAASEQAVSAVVARGDPVIPKQLTA